jgi:hypothetical protein
MSLKEEFPVHASDIRFGGSRVGITSETAVPKPPCTNPKKEEIELSSLLEHPELIHGYFDI